MPRTPNIVWVMADDLGSPLSFTGNAGVKTPHIDRLASEGMYFSRYYAAASTCAPSRTAIFTGMYPTYLNAQHHHSTPDFPPNVKHLAQRLRDDGGYFTANVVNVPDGYPFISFGKRDLCWSGQHDESLYDSADFSDLKAHQPFFAEFQCLEPHAPWHSLEMYAEEGLAVDPDKVELPPYYPDTPETRTTWARYLSSVQVFDAKVGKVREMLEQDGLLEDTVIMVLTDHGRDMLRGKFNLYDAGIHMPLVVWIPEQHRPAGYEPGTVSDRLTSGVDITPTMLSLAGVELPPNLHGAPFLGPDAKERRFAFAHRDRVITHIDRSRAVVDQRFHYIRNYMPDQPGFFPPSLYQQLDIGYDEVVAEMLRLRAEGKLTPEQEQVLAETRPLEELFDVEQDPHQLRNLAEDPEYVPVLRRMRTALQFWRAQTQDKGFLPEAPEGAQSGAFLVDFWVQTTGGTYNVDDYGVYDLPVSPKFAKLIQ
ncbi:MAG TPA: sulfatase [Microbacterium sp.]|nr:sulfatase [Microbacterium sp.]